MYFACLVAGLRTRGLRVDLDVRVPVVYRGLALNCGSKLDILVENTVVLEIKAIAAIAPVHEAVMLTYLRLSGCRIGLLINFHSAVLKDGVHRFVWNYNPTEEEAERRDAEVAEK